MLVLSIVFLVGMYVLKIFFPQEFVLAIENERIIGIGNFIDNNLWLRYICGGITSFITLWFYCCISCKRKKLGIKNIFIILATVVMLRVLSIYDMNLCTIMNTCVFFILPAIMNGNLKWVATTFTIHSFAQYLSLSIRGLPLYFTHNLNFLTTIIMSIDCYLWLLLLYVISNYKKEN